VDENLSFPAVSPFMVHVPSNSYRTIHNRMSPTLIPQLKQLYTDGTDINAVMLTLCLYNLSVVCQKLTHLYITPTNLVVRTGPRILGTGAVFGYVSCPLEYAPCITILAANLKVRLALNWSMGLTRNPHVQNLQFRGVFRLGDISLIAAVVSSLASPAALQRHKHWKAKPVHHRFLR
jgi:hypothetical protein